MVDIFQPIVDALTALGDFGLIVCIFLFFYIDSVIFPTLPELFAIGFFMVHPTPDFAVLILLTIVVSEVLGLATMYYIVKSIGLPRRIQAVLEGYADLLIVRDERVILLNRVAPIIPFTGAFAATCHWDFRKCIAYTVIGGVVKYGAILAFSTVMFSYLGSNEAKIITMILILTIIGISIALSLRRKKRLEARAREERLSSSALECPPPSVLHAQPDQQQDERDGKNGPSD
jgi:membrane protein YqaA with SNARE-associated domain